jgi:hypothetical protein
MNKLSTACLLKGINPPVLFYLTHPEDLKSLRTTNIAFISEQMRYKTSKMPCLPIYKNI